MDRYLVGQLYHRNRTQWPHTAEYNYRATQHELVLFMSDLTEDKINDIRLGASEFGILVEGNVIIFLYRFPRSIPWSVATCSWHLVSKSERSIPKLDQDNKPARLAIILVDADTGVIKALLEVWLGKEFTRSLHKALRDQAARPWRGAASYEIELRAAYRKYRNAALMRELAVLSKGRDLR